MKSRPSPLLRRVTLAAFALCAMSVTVAHAQSAGFQIGVRSGIDQAEKDKRDTDPAYGNDLSKHRRLFLLARVSEETAGSREKLVKPVNAQALAKQVTKQLEAQGFHPVGPNQKPEMIITVKYGRGQLMSNPYLDLDNLPASDPRKQGQHSNLSDSDKVGVQSHSSYVGREAKIQRLGYEQLIIQVRAWEYPPPKDPKEKEKLLWMTTMYAPDPDNTDLNIIADKLLAAGAPYFDKHIEREKEKVIDTSLPEGRVNVGPVEVVKPAQPK